MKITDVTVYEVKPRWIFVKLSTDEGVEGWGEMISGTKTETVVAGAREMGGYLIGRDPFEIERLWQEMYKSFFRGGPINGTIVSGMEMALWDIKGKYFGVPVYEAAGPGIGLRSIPGSAETGPRTWRSRPWTAGTGDLTR